MKWSCERSETASFPIADLPLPAGSGHEHDLGRLQRVEHFLHERGALQVKVRADGRADSAKNEAGVILEGEEDALLVRADRRVALLQFAPAGRPDASCAPRTWQCWRRQARSFQETRCRANGVALGHRVGQEALDVRFRLTRGAIKVQAQHMQHAKERPDVGRRDGVPSTSPMIFRSSPQYWTALSEIKPFVASRLLELCAVAGRAGAVEKTHEMLEECFGAPQRDKNEAVIRRREPFGALEVVPEILDRLLAVVVCCADGEAALDLAGEFLGGCSGALADDQEIIGLPPEVLCLEVDLQHRQCRSGSAECRARAAGRASTRRRAARRKCPPRRWRLGLRRALAASAVPPVGPLAAVSASMFLPFIRRRLPVFGVGTGQYGMHPVARPAA